MGNSKGKYGPGALITYIAAMIWLVFLSGCAGNRAADSGGVRSFTVFYTTDAHGGIVSEDGSIGLDLIAAIKDSAEHSVLLDAGDFMHGTSLVNMDQGMSVVSLMKQAGYFAVTVGNHEFSHGPEALGKSRELAATAPEMHLLSANVFSADGRLFFASDAKISLNEVDFCIFGLTTPDTAIYSRPDNVRGLTFLAPEPVAVDVVKRLRGEGCEVVAALSHLGSDSRFEHNSLELADNVPGLDVVIDGHSHRVVEKRTASGVLVVSSGAYGKLLGRLDISYDTKRGKVKSIANRFIAPDEAALHAPDMPLTKALGELQKKEAAMLSEVVGRSAEELEFSMNGIRSGETGLGNFCADALRNAHGTKAFTKQPIADIAIINSGAISAALPRGEVTQGDIYRLARFGGEVSLFRVSGRELRDIFEHAFRYLPDESGSFVQVSGLIIRVAPKKPAGQRVTSMRLAVSPCLGFREIEPDDELMLAVNDYLASGGDGFPHLHGKAKQAADVPLREALIKHLNKRGSGYYSGRPMRIICD